MLISHVESKFMGNATVCNMPFCSHKCWLNVFFSRLCHPGGAGPTKINIYIFLLW